MEACFLCQSLAKTLSQEDSEAVRNFCDFTGEICKDNLKVSVSEDFVTCEKCLTSIKYVLEERAQVTEVESRVRKVQLELLKELQVLKLHLDKLYVGLREVGKTAKDVDKDQNGAGNRELQKKIINGLRNLMEFKGLLADRLCWTTPKDISVKTESDIKARSSKRVRKKKEVVMVKVEVDVDPQDEEGVKVESLLNKLENDDDMASENHSWANSPENLDQNDEEWHVELVNYDDEEFTPSSKKSPRKKSGIKKQKQAKKQKKSSKDSAFSLYPCPKCDYVSGNKIGIGKHKVHRGHKATDEFTCSQCKQLFKDEDLLITHFNTDHSSVPITTMKKEVSVYKCEHCEEAFFTRKQFHTHRKTHQEHKEKKMDKRVPCDLCGRKVKILEIHQKFHCPKNEDLATFTEPRVCETCGKAFTTAKFFSRHVKEVCSKRGNFSCDLCGKSGFTTERWMKKHRSLHEIQAEQRRKYLCGLCGRDFGHVSHLRRHERKCDGSKKPTKPRWSNMIQPVVPVEKKPESSQEKSDK